ncbi:unnamed protein product [Didymodactylos carnosus]|uniref:Dynein light chain n=2 Tax=Didymodactylos carnosus TaxID=1234261 RepID=A0A814I466_9BILA|nr:unnamed protein product [Didymodactylos carnosus]CAF3789970.1 unnamed protein product [Didymodactylos carnosus]
MDVAKQQQETMKLSDANAAAYTVRPNFEEKFRSTKIQDILYSCISDVLGDKKYEQEACSEWTKTITINIRDRLKSSNMKLERYKFIVQCVIGENKGQGVKYGCRCLWDSDTDGMAEYVYLNESLFCAVATFGIFYY